MSRSPLSPAGKRMRTMDDLDESDDEDIGFIRIGIAFPSPYGDRVLSGGYDDDVEDEINRGGEEHGEDEGEEFDYDGFRREANAAIRALNKDRIIEGRTSLNVIGAMGTRQLEDDIQDGDDDNDSSSSSSGGSSSGSSDSSSDSDDNYDADEIDLGDESNHTLDSLSSGYDGRFARHYGAADEMDDFLDYDSEDDDEIDHCRPEEYLKHDPTPETQYPKPDWISVNELLRRKKGLTFNGQASRSGMRLFERRVNNSLWMIQRLVPSKHLEEHTGSVNSLDFNSEGNLLCSSSDDLAVCVWDWQLNKLRKKINTGHINDVIYSQFCNSDANIITGSRDGTVRLLNIETSLSELLMSQSGEIGELAFITPQTLVICGTNACVNFIDLRVREPTKLFVVRNPKNNRSCALHTINSHPIDKHRIVVAGQSPYVYLYDLRRVARNPNEMEHRCINNFEQTNHIVTSTAFNPTGDKLLLSYNDDDLFVCRTGTCEIVHRYKGHRNKKTIKGCAWFGDNFVMSGSDDGHIYGWDLQSEHIVCFLEKFKGAVNCLSVHPTMPVLASSGLDHNVKVWEPISRTWPQTLKGIKPQICKNTMRRMRAQGRRNQPINQSGDEGESDMDL